MPSCRHPPLPPLPAHPVPAHPCRRWNVASPFIHDITVASGTSLNVFTEGKGGRSCQGARCERLQRQQQRQGRPSLASPCRLTASPPPVAPSCRRERQPGPPPHRPLLQPLHRHRRGQGHPPLPVGRPLGPRRALRWVGQQGQAAGWGRLPRGGWGERRRDGVGGAGCWMLRLYFPSIYLMHLLSARISDHSLVCPRTPAGRGNTYWNLTSRSGAPLQLPTCGFGPLLNFVGNFAGDKVSALRWACHILAAGAGVLPAAAGGDRKRADGGGVAACGTAACLVSARSGGSPVTSRLPLRTCSAPRACGWWRRWRGTLPPTFTPLRWRASQRAGDPLTSIRYVSTSFLVVYNELPHASPMPFQELTCTNHLPLTLCRSPCAMLAMFQSRGSLSAPPEHGNPAQRTCIICTPSLTPLRPYLQQAALCTRGL